MTREAVPSIVDANGSAWVTRDSGNPTRAYVIPEQRVMVAPEDDSEASGAVRAHEYLHVRFSMQTPFPESLPLRYLQAAEDGRVHTLARLHGIAGMFAALPLRVDDARAAHSYASRGDVRELASLLVCGYGVARGLHAYEVVQAIASGDASEAGYDDEAKRTARAALARFARCAEVLDGFASDPLSAVRVAEILAEEEPEPDEDEENGENEDEENGDGPGSGDGPGESEGEPSEESEDGDGSGNGEPSEGDANGEPSEGDANGEPSEGDANGEPSEGDANGESKPEPSQAKPEPSQAREREPEPSKGNGSESKLDRGAAKPESYAEARERLAELAKNAPTMREREASERSEAGEPRGFAWSAPVWRETRPRVPVRISGAGAYARGFASGPRVAQPTRYATDGRVFAKRLPASVGTVLIDASGSTALRVEHLESIVRAIPAALVVAYDCSGAFVLAKNGRRVAEIPDALGGSNGSDGLLLEWLASKPEPRVWVSDGAIHENGSEPPVAEHARLTALAKRARIVRVDPAELDALASALRNGRVPKSAEPFTC